MNSKQARGLIKAITARNLQGSWLKAFFIFLITILASSLILGLIPFRTPSNEQIIAAAGDAAAMLKLFLPAEITKKTLAAIGVVALLSIIVLCPMNIGKCRFFLRVAAGQPGEMGDFFSVFCSIKLVFSSIVLDIIIAVATAFWTFVFSAVPIAFAILSAFLKSDLLFMLSYLLAFAAGFFSVFWCSRYDFARYILAEGNLGAFAAFGECRRLCKGRGGELCALRASYIIWDVAAAFFTPVMYIYHTLIGAVYARYLYHIRGDIEFVARETVSAENSDAEKNVDDE